MKKSLKRDITELSVIAETLVGKLPTMSLEEKVELNARMRAVTTNLKAFDDNTKAAIEKKHGPKYTGDILGEDFKGIRAYVPSERFDAKAFKEAEPIKYEKYLVDASYYRIDYKLR